MRNGKDFWWNEKRMIVDREIYRTAGVSMRIHNTGGSVLRQYLPKEKLKSETTYKLSFFIKLKDVSGGKAAPRAGVTTDVRFGNGGRNFVFYPFTQALTGTMEWTRFEFEFKTPANVGAKFMPYIGFYLNSKCTGTAWVDHVELVEVKK